MNSVDFPESNTNFGPPKGMTEEQVASIPAAIVRQDGGQHDGLVMVIVAWEPSPDELRALISGARVFITMRGGCAPHFVTTSFAEARNSA